MVVEELVDLKLCVCVRVRAGVLCEGTCGFEMENEMERRSGDGVEGECECECKGGGDDGG